MIYITSKTENTVRLFDSGRQQTNVDRESDTENMYIVTVRFAQSTSLYDYVAQLGGLLVDLLDKTAPVRSRCRRPEKLIMN